LDSNEIGDKLAAEAFAVLGTGRQIRPFSTQLPGFSLDDAYRVAAAVRGLRETRGETPIGRKIGFTNRVMWPDYPPMWGYVYDRTVHQLADIGHTFSINGLAEPRIEPEIVFRVAATPTPGMDERALLESINGVAHGLEIVQSIFPGWAFTAPDAVAAYGLHAALLVGPWHLVTDSEDWLQPLSTFTVELLCDEKVLDYGRASNVLGGPLTALHHLVDLLARDPVNPPLAAGDIITTGTLTGVPAIAPGETWSTELSGVVLEGIAVRFGWAAAPGPGEASIDGHGE
jgi:2-oxo-3-hexenedioate decarboxylase